MRPTVYLALAMLGFAGTPLFAQTDGTCVPVSERGARTLGCYITARHELGRLTASPPLYWHIERHATRQGADRARAADRRSTGVESFGKIWVFTIAPLKWRSRRGESVARIGPIPLVDAKEFAAVYMEAAFEPGMSSMVHRHDGAEAWLTLEGSQCLETSEGKLEQKAGDPGVIVPAGLPMVLTGIGTGIRRSLVLILQDATKPRSTPAMDWTPKGLCRMAPAR
jgi:quercetin dioxygenase-like cupin family protein